MLWPASHFSFSSESETDENSPEFRVGRGRKIDAGHDEDDFNQRQINEELSVIRSMINKGKLQKLKDLTDEAILEMAKKDFPSAMTEAMALGNLRSSLNGGGKKRPKNKTKKKRSRKKTRKKRLKKH